jgi:hypothetical protein
MIQDRPIPGVTTDQRSHPAGREGARLSLREVAERAWKARMSPRLRAWATQTLDKAGVSNGTRRQKAQAILDAYRAKVPYVADPVLGEFMATPEQTLCLDENGLCIIGGDCFPEGTLLLRDDFAFVPIEAIKVGEKIWGRDRWSTVTEKWAKGRLAIDLIEAKHGIEYDDATVASVRLTSDHKVYVQKEISSPPGAPQRYAYNKDGLPDYERIPVSELRRGHLLLQPREENLPDPDLKTETHKTKVRRNPPDVPAFWREITKRRREHVRFGLEVANVQRGVDFAACWDISTDDHYVYLPEHDVTVSNCDDAAITLQGALMSIGIPAMTIGSAHKEPVDVPTHVFMAFQDSDGEWVRMDGTAKHPVGRVSPHKREWWVEPGAEAKERGEGDFVGMAGGQEVGVSRAPASTLVSRLDLLYPSIK